MMSVSLIMASQFIEIGSGVYTMTKSLMNCLLGHVSAVGDYMAALQSFGI